MAQGKLQPKFERNPGNNFRDNRSHSFVGKKRLKGRAIGYHWRGFGYPVPQSNYHKNTQRHIR